MKKKQRRLAKINNTKSWFFKINDIEKLLEMKMEKSQQITQKHKDYEITMSNYMPIKWTTWKKWTNS